MIGRDLISTLAPESERERLRVGMTRLIGASDGTVSRKFQADLVRLDGAVFPAEVSIGVVFGPHGYLVHAFARDISERVLAELAARKYLDDLNALVAVGRELATPSKSATVRSTICTTALALTGGAFVILLEPEGEDLVTTASAGRPAPVSRVPLDSTSNTAVATVYRTGRPIFSGRLADDPRVSSALAASAHVNAGYWQPIKGPAGTTGVLAVFWDEGMEALDPRFESMLNLLATQAEVALEMVSMLGRLDQLARTDGLTGIANRRTFDEALARELARAARSTQPLSLILLDLDHFKRYNDSRGHQAGDHLLSDAAVAWERELRPADLLARYGGEEFAIILPDCPPEAAMRVADRLRRDVPGGQTVSAGIATWAAGETPEALIARADAAMYQAKAAGRDRAVAG